jgi:hypothetical protein
MAFWAYTAVVFEEILCRNVKRLRMPICEPTILLKCCLGSISGLRGKISLNNRLRNGMVALPGRKGDHGVPRIRISGAIRHAPLYTFMAC